MIGTLAEGRRISGPLRPAVVRKEITRLLGKFKRQHRSLFMVDPKLKDGPGVQIAPPRQQIV